MMLIGGGWDCTFEEVQDVVSKMLMGGNSDGTWILENDLKAIGISNPWRDIRDTTMYQPYMWQASHDASRSLQQYILLVSIIASWSRLRIAQLQLCNNVVGKIDEERYWFITPTITYMK